MREVDVVVVGAGPVGCVAALAHARRGARVALVEAQPARKNRFAGELLHPPAVAALRRVGVDGLKCAAAHGPNRGFAVYPEGREDIRLHHPGPTGATMEFNHLVTELREAALANELVTWLPGWRATALDGHRLEGLDADGAADTIRAGRIVAADGRFSVVRKALGLPDDRTPLSNMAGLLLRGVTLPHEGFGHVVLGGEGPVLVYRIGEDAVRVCIDVPLAWKKAGDRERRIWRSLDGRMPAEVSEAIRAELEAGRVLWAVNELRPRLHYHRGPVALVGDAVGHFHPMTGIGMTLGFGDAVALADHGDLDAWARERHHATLSPGLLATALYEIFAVRSEPTEACREAVYRLWDGDEALRQRTMAILSCQEPSLARLLSVGFQMVGRAAVDVTWRNASSRTWGQGAEAVGRLAGLVHWLLAESVPPSMRILPAPSVTPFERVRVGRLPVADAA
jgi:2-polyprenyl-6-methoxyphenol hydroxylase-like FAD-dependent oxidoreductase